MKLYIMRDISASDSVFTVFNESGGEKYFVTSVKSHGTTKFLIKNKNNIIVSKIRRISLPNLYAYNISANGRALRLIFNTVKGELVCFCYGVNWHVCGDLFAKSFSIVDVDNTLIATHKKAFSVCCDGYELTVFNDANELVCLSASICINMFNAVDKLVTQAV